MSFTAKQQGELPLETFISSLEDPEELMPLFWPGADESASKQKNQLQNTCRHLFQEVESMAKIHISLVNKSIVLSGLDELYAGDAETLWGQVELQNAALNSLLKTCTKKVTRMIESKGQSQVRLLDMREITSEKDDDDADSRSAQESDEDEETARIRARMERAMADTEDTDDDEGLDAAANNKETPEEKPEAQEEDDLEDPAAEELNDGFFDIQEMEAFADEEEEYLPEEAFGTAQPEEDNDEVKKSFHQRQREGDIDSGSSDDDELAFQTMDNTVRRRKYRGDDEIEALYSLYQEPQDDNFDDDDVVNMTAADFFGKPNKKYFDKWNSVGHHETSTSNDFSPDNFADSWDEHNFEDQGPGWSDEPSDDDDENNKFAGAAAETDIEEKKPVASSSAHARHTGKLQRQTEQVEKDLLAEKPWQMTGEAKSSSRPVNSLLDGAPEFEVATKMAPLITVEHTANLEDVIKRRILDDDWDDVIPRELPDVAWNKKKGELPEVSQEKSKLGLGELYEREYLKKAVGYDVDATEKQTEEEKARNEMKALFANLCSKLDALTNYHFAPRPVADEAEVRAVTTPAIAMEEVLPLRVSDARGAAPEEVYGAKKGREGVLRGESELDQAERKRHRAARKAARRKRRKEKLADEKLISKLQPGLGLNNPYEKRKMRDELSMARSKGKVTDGSSDSHTDYGTSGKFFKRLQEEAEQAVHPVGGSKKKQKRSHNSNSQKSSAFKL